MDSMPDESTDDIPPVAELTIVAAVPTTPTASSSSLLLSSSSSTENHISSSIHIMSIDIDSKGREGKDSGVVTVLHWTVPAVNPTTNNPVPFPKPATKAPGLTMRPR
jgi:hypothetical protein